MTRKQHRKWKKRLRSQYARACSNRALLQRLQPKLQELETIAKRNREHVRQLEHFTQPRVSWSYHPDGTKTEHIIPPTMTLGELEHYRAQLVPML